MPVQCGTLFEPFGTKWTNVGADVGVNLHVSPQHFLGLEAVATLVALMVPDILMDCLPVVLQSLGLSERSPTSVASEVPYLGNVEVDSVDMILQPQFHV